MTCPHCGTTDIPEGSAACPRCGGPLALAQGAPGARGVERVATAPAPARKPYLLAGILAAIIVLLIIALILMWKPNRGVTQAPQVAPPTGPPITAAPVPEAPAVGPPVTQAPAARPPVVQAPVEDPNKAAVQAYIQRVGQIERQRQTLVTNIEPLLIEMTVLKMGMDNPLLGPMADLLEADPEAAMEAKKDATGDSAARVQQILDGYVNQLRVLDQQLRSIQPVPQPAFDFARAYDEALARYAGAIVQISQILTTGTSDPSQAAAQAQRLSSMKGGLQLQAEQGLRNADAQLTTLTQRYGLPKPFDITDTPRGSVTGL